MTAVLDLARPELRALTPYSSARMEAAAAAVMLNANESPWPPPGDDGRALNRYPQPQPEALRQRLAQIYAVQPEQLLVGRGSDEAIDLLLRAFCRPAVDAIAVCPPTFGMYAVCAAVQGADVVRVPLDADFAVDADALLGALPSSAKLVFLCSPNNPTGGIVPLVVIERLAAALADRCLLIVDEAYVEFAGIPSAACLLARHDNLAVLRTLSKAWGLAGARIGCLLASAGIVALLRRIMPPYPIPTPCSVAAMRALGAEGEALMHERVATIVAERTRLAAALGALPQVRAVLPSQANFLTLRLRDARAAYSALADRGIVVRDVSHYPGLAQCLRISIGTAQENNQVLSALQSLPVARVVEHG